MSTKIVRHGSTTLATTKWDEVKADFRKSLEADLDEYGFDYTGLSIVQKNKALIGLQFKDRIRRIRRNQQQTAIQATLETNQQSNETFVSDFVEDTADD